MKDAEKNGSIGKGILKQSDVFLTVVVCAISVLVLIAGATFAHLSYFFVSSTIMVISLIAFFISTENRAISSRELAMIATMCALAIISRAVFIWIPHFKPIAAIVMITAVSFGGRAGFLTGSTSMLVSNFIFGQGPWTPWQMVAYGIAGAIFGILADKGVIPRCDLSRKRLLASSFLAAATVVFIVGPVLDLYSLFSMFSILNVESALSILIAGLPINLVQASAVFLTFFICANPLLGILDRVRLKYSLD